jgi:hypothetical protein
MNDAETSFDHIQPMVRYMWVFRTLGIGMFLFILLTSAFMISVKLSLAFLVLTVSAYVYMHLHGWMEIWRRRRRMRAFLPARLSRIAARDVVDRMRWTA